MNDSVAAPPSPEYLAQDKGPTTLLVAWTVNGVATGFVVARLWVRGKVLGRLRADDYIVILALACSCLSTAFTTEATRWGSGRHFDLLTLEQKSNVLKWGTAAFAPGIMSFALPKIAVIMLLIRLLNPSRRHVVFLWSMGLWCLVSLIAVCGVLLGHCVPIESLWDFSVPGTCFPANIMIDYIVYAGAVSVFVDMYLVTYPAVVLFKLRLPLTKKIVLGVALSLGLGSAAVTIYKATRIPLLTHPDYSYETADLVIWTVIEGSIIIVACTVPILHPIMEGFLRLIGARSTGKPSVPYYENYSGNCRRSIELGQRMPKAKLRDEFGFTIVNEEGSQENILPNEKTGAVTTLAAATAEPPSVRREGEEPSEGIIIRTAGVSVTYENRKGKGVSEGVDEAPFQVM